MIYAEQGTKRLSLSNGQSYEDDYSGWHAVAPIAVGSAAPMIISMLLAPSLFAKAMPFVMLAMAALLVGVVAIAIYSLLRKGDVVSMTFDPASRVVELTHGGLFATSLTRLPAASIVSIEMASAFDDDGYRWQYPELVTRRGERFVLPAGITNSELSAFRQAMAGAHH